MRTECLQLTCSNIAAHSTAAPDELCGCNASNCGNYTIHISNWMTWKGASGKNLAKEGVLRRLRGANDFATHLENKQACRSTQQITQ